MTLIEIEAKKSVLESQKKAATDAINLALAPLQAQLHQIENQAQKLVLEATQTISGIDGRIAVLDELRAELVPPAPVDTDVPTTVS